MFDFSSNFSLFCYRKKGSEKRIGDRTQFKALLKEIFKAEGVRHVRLNVHLKLNMQPLEPVQLLYAPSTAQLNYAETIVQCISSI